MDYLTIHKMTLLSTFRRVYHERQYDDHCALHAINSLLQNPVFTVEELTSIGSHLDKHEMSLIDQTSSNNTEKTSENFDERGNFSIQVITAALALCQLELISFNSSDSRALFARQYTCGQQAFICHERDHWFTVRKFGSDKWYNLDSLLFAPEELSHNGIHISLFNRQQKINRFTGIFIVLGNLKEAKRNFEIAKLSNSLLTRQVETPWSSFNYQEVKGKPAMEKNDDIVEDSPGTTTRKKFLFGRRSLLRNLPN